VSGVEKNRPGTPAERERLLKVLSAATFVIFFQAFMVAPIMGLNVFVLFIGFGLGSLVFAGLLRFGFGTALGIFAVVEAAAALACGFQCIPPTHTDFKPPTILTMPPTRLRWGIRGKDCLAGH